MTQTADNALVSLTAQLPYLLRAIHVLGHRYDPLEDAEELAHELSSITAMVASKFTNDRTAEGILEALRLTVGCISLGLARMLPHENDEAALELLIEQGCERVFQQGYRAIKELAQLPDVAIISIYDRSPQEQERRLKATFKRYCEADPNDYWMGYKNFQREWMSRTKIQATLDCALWLRKHHSGGAISDPDIDADGTIAIALIFAVPNGGKVIAKAGQRLLESTLTQMRDNPPDFEKCSQIFLDRIPQKFHQLLLQRIEYLKTSSLVKILEVAINSKTRPSKVTITKLFNELRHHGGNEIEVAYE